MPHHPRRSRAYRPPYDDDDDDARSLSPTKDSSRSGGQDSNRDRMRHRSPTPPATTDRDVFDEDLENFFRRAIRAYELVRSYPRDCRGGTRWSRSAVEEVRKFGIDLHNEVNALKRHLREYKERNNWDELEMEYMRDEVEKVREYCENVMTLINDLERVPLHQRMSRNSAGQNQEHDEE
ncbi:hypothetical protein L13192_00866 [Pyrenophora tritici-repentis]|uniref:Uncharacterized protein n=3 Tax=Pyrenophora tritici-repentis TaxID=45151 RepID=A0A922SRJ0_9PLEO|nr:uncharacterized protein PTRG_01625 [Pyrenophora tritici-repentis Pt-1C-BFP]EDU41063.1 predicted protein [Pyrenophora tritici-repentis Pt-1C-BFP]KAI1513761.1 hypothetical protein Ptr86124_007663 [Pyrenophora tritici-repentis]KAI1674119.1 hypothetical protein L13192_00866 [Pyrenophora tritici-repentis]KAI1688779.1 hypothetical protein KJE20_01957 [Pyrenophora tritici-repentis]